MKIELLDDPDEYARTARSQREWAVKLAAKIERDEPLGRFERMIVAALLRAGAERIPDSPPRRPGKAPRVDPGAVVFDFLAATERAEDPMSRNRAYEHLAEKYGCSEQWIKQILAKARTSK